MELTILILAICGLAVSVAVLALGVVLLLRAKRPEADTARVVQDAVRREVESVNRETALLIQGYQQTLEGHLQQMEARSQQGTETTAARLAEIGDRMHATLSAQRMETEQKLNEIRTLLDTSNRQNLQLTQDSLDALRREVSAQLTTLREDNHQQMERMRKVVDEELHTNLQNRLNESFERITDNLQKVYKSMGEMQAMTTGMNDLKRVLSGVKTRGVWGEASLSTLLTEILTPEQYVENFAPSARSANVVEFAVKLPGKSEGEEIYLPIDSKFPREDYERLVEAADQGDKEGVEACGKALETRVKAEARDIRDKYIKPPRTTGFGVLYVPIEGLYAEVLRRPGLTDTLRNEFGVLVAGPTTLAALLNSLQIGFKTLAVERRSKEIWQLLALIQRQFNQFAASLDKAERQLDTAAKTLHETGERTRKINSRLSSVQQLEQYSSVAADDTDDTEDDQ